MLCPIRLAALLAPHKTAVSSIHKNYSYQELDTHISFCQHNIKDLSETLSFIPSLSFNSIVFLFACLRQGKTVYLLNSRNPLTLNMSLTKQVKGRFIDTIEQYVEQKIFLEKSISYFSSKIYISTSGSTSLPKIVILTPRSFFINSLAAIEKLRITEQDTYLLSLPLFHVSGLSILFRTFISKAALFLPEKGMSLLETKANVVSLVPTQLIRLLDALSLPAQFKCLLVGGAYLSEDLYFEAVKANLPIALTYGMSETSSQLLLCNKPVIRDGRYYLGFPHKYSFMKLDQNKEILVKGDTLFKGYFGQKPHVGWFKTKDIGAYHKTYGFSFVGRKDNLFISGGENIYPEEIIRSIYQCGRFEEVFVLPVKDPAFGHRPVCFILAKKFCENTIKKQLERILPKYKIPIHFFDLSRHKKNGLKWHRQDLKKIAEKENFCL
ncbi:MAG: hypothetical protein COT84_07655 [Chlamydiae bacterium CG10_big_fil_rev_8_21_14_0_10_35_9]|nr:MAG: hypothetical protein COT84_07655 [Chlamydiae bacterium CG10_big_fil_rev_8_21_14_0_10_35_9]